MKSPDATFRAAIAVVVVLAAVALSACGASATAPAAHDDGVVRVVGLGWTGLVGALDRLAASAFVLLPVGTRVLRASLASAALAGACAWVLTDLGDRLARAALAPLLPSAPRLTVAAAGAASLAAVLAPAYQREASAPGGALAGALVLLLALREATASIGAGDDRGPRAPTAALLVGLAATVDVFVLGATVAVFAPHARALLAQARAGATHVAVCLVVGVAPLLTSLATRARVPEIALATSSGYVPELAGGRGRAAIVAFLGHHVGVVVVVAAGMAAVIVALGLRRTRGRAARTLVDAQIAVAAIVIVAGVSIALGGAPESRTSPVALAASGAVHAQAAVALAGVALGIARAPVPFAHASAALVVVLEVVLPVRAADETLAAREIAPRDATATWIAAAFDRVPPAAALLVGDRVLVSRLAAARAAGELRSDVLVVPLDDVRSRVSARALLVEPKLAPLHRDLALGSPPEELSLTQLAAARPVLVTFERTWDRSLARHLVPVGLFARFDAEPRGAVDRKRAFDAVSSVRDKLVRAVLARRDPELVALTARLLRARALGVAATGDRELVSRALDELRPFAPDDPVSTQLVRRLVTSKGAIEIRDLGP